MGVEFTLNSREEVYQWILEHYKEFEPTAYIQVLETIKAYDGIALIGDSKNGGVSKRITFPNFYEVYPMEFSTTNFSGSIWGRFKGETQFTPPSVNPPWLIKMILCTLFKRGGVNEFKRYEDI